MNLHMRSTAFPEACILLVSGDGKPYVKVIFNELKAAQRAHEELVKAAKDARGPGPERKIR